MAENFADFKKQLSEIAQKIRAEKDTLSEQKKSDYELKIRDITQNLKQNFPQNPTLGDEYTMYFAYAIMDEQNRTEEDKKKWFEYTQGFIDHCPTHPDLANRIYSVIQNLPKMEASSQKTLTYIQKALKLLPKDYSYYDDCVQLSKNMEFKHTSHQLKDIYHQEYDNDLLVFDFKHLKSQEKLIDIKEKLKQNFPQNPTLDDEYTMYFAYAIMDEQNRTEEDKKDWFKHTQNFLRNYPSQPDSPDRICNIIKSLPMIGESSQDILFHAQEALELLPKNYRYYDNCANYIKKIEFWNSKCLANQLNFDLDKLLSIAQTMENSFPKNPTIDDEYSMYQIYFRITPNNLNKENQKKWWKHTKNFIDKCPGNHNLCNQLANIIESLPKMGSSTGKTLEYGKKALSLLPESFLKYQECIELVEEMGKKDYENLLEKARQETDYHKKINAYDRVLARLTDIPSRERNTKFRECFNEITPIYTKSEWGRLELPRKRQLTSNRIFKSLPHKAQIAIRNNNNVYCK